MRPREYTVGEVFQNSIIGLKFDFFSSKNTEYIVEDLSRALSKSVVPTNDEKILPTWSTPILLKEYSGKKPRYQLKIAPQNYVSLLPGIDQTIKWINENTALDYNTKMSVSLSFDHGRLNTVHSLSNVDAGWIILKIDENFIYNKFPMMRKSPSCLSVKKIIPLDGFMNMSNMTSSISAFSRIPMDEYYGIDFSEKSTGIIRFNYIGGPDYASKPYNINETLKYYIISTYQVLNSVRLSTDMIHELDKLTEKYSTIRRCYNEPLYFLKEFKDIKVSVDLKGGDEIIKTYWDRLRTPILKTILESNFQKGYFNYDSELGRFEIKDSQFSGSRISGFNIINCKISGVLENCHLWRSTIENSRVKKSVIVAGNTVSSSIIEGCRADRSNTVEKSYIINNGEIINCKVNESIIKNAGIGSSAKLDEQCTLIDDGKKEMVPMDKGIGIEEIRDYKWIKSMRQSSDSGFANEFKISY